jgi:hypothetical protein
MERRRLAGCGKAISAQPNFDGLHLCHNRRTSLQDAQKGRHLRLWFIWFL